MLGFAEDTRAFAKGALFVFLDLKSRVKLNEFFKQRFLDLPSSPTLA